MSTRQTSTLLLLGILISAGLAQAETLERVISREDPKFDCASAGMSAGRDGNVYLCSGGYVLRVSRDGTQKGGGNVASDGIDTHTVANTNGLVAVGNGHMNEHHVHIYNQKFAHVAACGDFPGKDRYSGGPLHVEAGASDFYGLQQNRKHIIRISPLGVNIKDYAIHPDAKAADFRVSEATQTFVVRGGDGMTRGVSFSGGEVKWTKRIPGLFDVDAAGRVVFLDGATLKWLDPDDLNPDEMLVSKTTVTLPADQIAGVNAMSVCGDELIIKRPDPTELFQVYDLKTGKQKRVVRTEHERVSAEFPNGVWTAGQPLPFRIQSSNASAQWHVWATPFGDTNWRELKRSGDQVEVPADFAGLYQIRVAPTLNALADSELTLRTIVEVRAPDSKGTVSVWTPLNRIWWGCGEAIPANVLLRTKSAAGPVAAVLNLKSEISNLKSAGAVVWSTNLTLTANAATTFTLPSAFTAQLAPGRYELRTSVPGFTCVAQPIRIGPGLAARSPFRTTCYGDYANFNSMADAWSFADVADDMLAQSQALGINQYINRTVFYRYPTTFADTADARQLFSSLERRLAADPDGVATQKVAFGFAQAHVLGAYSAFGLREWLMPVVMDGTIQLNAGWTGKGTSPADSYAGIVRDKTQALTNFPAFVGWDWAANWWAAGSDGDRFEWPPSAPKAVVKAPVLGEKGAGKKDDLLDALENQQQGKGTKTPSPPSPLTEKQRYLEALKKADETGAWDPVLDVVGDRPINWQPLSQLWLKQAMDQVFDAGAGPGGPHFSDAWLKQAQVPFTGSPGFHHVNQEQWIKQAQVPGAANLSTASSGPYRRPEIYPPANFFNVDEVDLHYQAEAFSTPNWTAHAADYYKRPGKPAWIHPEFIVTEIGTGDHVLPFTWMAVMRGVDGFGESGTMPWHSLFRTLNEFARQYGPWLTTLENHDRVAIVVSHRQVKLDRFTCFFPLYFVRLFEAYQSCLYAHQPATFLYTEDVKPDTLRKFKALLVVAQQYEPEPALAKLLAQAQQQGIAIFADGTCRESLVKGYTPLGLSFDHIEKLNGFNNPGAFTDFPPVLLANAPLVAAKLGKVVPPVAVVDYPQVLVSERSQGDARFVWVVNNTPIQLNPELLGRVGWAIGNRQPVVTKVTLPVEKGEVVYDVFAGKEVAGARVQGSGIEFDADLRYGGARVYAVVPGAIQSLELQAPKELKAGQTFTWTATVPGLKARLPLHVELRDAAGALLDERFTTTGTGSFTVPVNAAMPVTFSAAELISGKSSSASAPTSDLRPLSSLFGPRLNSIAVSADGATAVTASCDWGQNLFALDLATGKVRWTGAAGDHYAGVWLATPAGFMIDGFDLGTAEGYHFYQYDAAGQLTRRFAFPGFPKMLTDSRAGALAPGGEWVAAAGNLALAVWATDGKLLWSQDWSATNRALPRLLALGKDVLVVTSGLTLTAYEARTGRSLWTVTPAPDGEIQGLVAGADGRTVVVRTSSRSGRVFLVRDGKMVGTLPTGAGGAVVAPDGSWVIVTAGRELKRYTMAGELQWVYRADDTLQAPGLSPDGKQMAVGSAMGRLHVFDVTTGEVRTRDLGAQVASAWMPDGDLVAATWMGTVARFDARLQEKWRIYLAASVPATNLPREIFNLESSVFNRQIPTSRLTSWSNAEPTPLPLTPNLLTADIVKRTLSDGGGTIETTPARLRVTAITLVEDPAHPESWMRDARLEYWDETQKTWILAQYLTSDAAVHSHKLRQPVEASKFRFAPGAGWPTGGLRLVDIVFQGETLRVDKPSRAKANAGPERDGALGRPSLDTGKPGLDSKGLPSL